jgi:arginyl-tRNA synthetase
MVNIENQKELIKKLEWIKSGLDNNRYDRLETEHDEFDYLTDGLKKKFLDAVKEELKEQKQILKNLKGTQKLLSK